MRGARGAFTSVGTGAISHTNLAKGSRFLITMGCGESCPVIPGAKREDWPLQDPKGQPADAVTKIRDEVRERVRSFVAREGWARA